MIGALPDRPSLRGLPERLTLGYALPWGGSNRHPKVNTTIHQSPFAVLQTPRHIPVFSLFIAAVCFLFFTSLSCSLVFPHRQPALEILSPCHDDEVHRFPAPTLRILIREGCDALTVTSSGPVSAVDPFGGFPLDKGDAGDRWTISLDRSASGCIRLSRDDREIRCFLPMILFIVERECIISIDGREYGGNMLVLPGNDGLDLVNCVDVETYLRGVLAAEIGRLGEGRYEALKAQAVASRGYALFQASMRRYPHYDLRADVLDQVYTGAASGDSIIASAVKETEGLVLFHSDTLAVTYFSSTCGGHTQDVRDVWENGEEEVPFLLGVRDRLGNIDGTGRDLCEISPHYWWERRYSPEEIEEVFGEYLSRVVEEEGNMRESSKRVIGRGWTGIGNERTCVSGGRNRVNGSGDPDYPGRLLDIEIVEKTREGRVRELGFVFEDGSFVVTGDRIRWALCSPEESRDILKSNFFSLGVVRDGRGKISEVILHGRGFGHGVGMCQWGALRMAELGFTYEEILRHYYPGTDIVKIYP